MGFQSCLTDHEIGFASSGSLQLFAELLCEQQGLFDLILVSSQASDLLLLGAELVLHGHKHRRRINHVLGPDGSSVPIIGVPSSSEVGSRPDKQAQYHVYTVTGQAGAYRLDAEVRGWDEKCGEFVSVDEALLE